MREKPLGLADGMRQVDIKIDRHEVISAVCIQQSYLTYTLYIPPLHILPLIIKRRLTVRAREPRSHYLETAEGPREELGCGKSLK